MGVRCVQLRAELEDIAKGSPMSVCWRPYKGRAYHQIARLDPVQHGVWDLRSAEPRPGLRVFFCLGERDSLVALTCSPRSVVVPWLARPPLGPRQSSEWKRAIRECRSVWNELFPGHRPLVGETLDDCFSNAQSD
jgi:hypothetical protein